MWRFKLAAFAVGFASVVTAHAAQQTIYDGNALPTAQGWQRQALGTPTEVVVTNAGVTQFTTATAQGAITGDQQLY